MSDLFGNPEDRFSHVEAHINLIALTLGRTKKDLSFSICEHTKDQEQCCESALVLSLPIDYIITIEFKFKTPCHYMTTVAVRRFAPFKNSKDRCTLIRALFKPVCFVWVWCPTDQTDRISHHITGNR